MEFDLIDNHWLVIERVGKKYKITLVVPPTRKPVPVRTLGKVFWFDWLRNKSFMAELAEKVGCPPNNLVAPLEAISSKIELDGKRILEPARPPKKTESDRKVVDISLLDDEGKFEFKALDVADKITDKDRFITHRKSHVIWVYGNGLYTDDGEEVIREGVRVLLGDEAKEAWVNEVVAHITETTYTYPEKFNAPLDLVNVKNGILNIKTNELLPHTPDTIFINELLVNYDPQKQCPEIMEFLLEILDASYIPLVQEIVGYCLLRDYPFARAVMLLGGGANGKSTLLNLVAALLGTENVAAPSLQDLIENYFSRGELFGKLANIHADIPSSKLVSTGIFKMLTGQDIIRADVKYKKAFKFRNYAKLLYSANELPKTEDMSEAFWRRWIIIKFTRLFREDDPKTDPHLLKKLTTPDELSGFLNWALEGLHRLLKQGYFTRTEAWVDTEKEWIRGTDSLRAFANERVRVKRGVFTTKADFYDKLKAFCVEHELECPTMSAVGHRLPSIIPQTGWFLPTVEGKRVKAWRDIYVIDDTDVTDNLETIGTIIEEKIDDRKKDDIYGESFQNNGNIGCIGPQTVVEEVSKEDDKRDPRSTSGLRRPLQEGQKHTAEPTISAEKRPTWLPCEFLTDHPRSAFIDPDTDKNIDLGPFERGDTRGIPAQFAHQMALKGIVKIMKGTAEQPKDLGEIVTLPLDIQGLPGAAAILAAISDGAPYLQYKIPKMANVPRQICFDTLVTLEEKGYVKSEDWGEKVVVKITDKGKGALK